MRGLLKQFAVVRALNALVKEFRQNPDLLSRCQKAFFEYRFGALSITTPTPEEASYIAELRAEMSALPLVVPTADTPGPERRWMTYKNQLREKIRTEDPRYFLTWDVIAWAMGSMIRRADFIRLTQMNFWPSWSSLLQVAPTSISAIQYPYFKFKYTDGRTLQQVFHLAQWHKLFGRDISSVACIVEFGGGYGAMCLAAHALGFRGKYIIYDTPEFLLLQKFFLKLHGIDLSSIHFVSSIPELTAHCADGKCLFIGMWSVSEVSPDLRDSIFSALNPTDYIIGYQKMFAGVDNYAYFENFARTRPAVKWHDYGIFEIRGAGDRYLIGSSTT